MNDIIKRYAQETIDCIPSFNFESCRVELTNQRVILWVGKIRIHVYFDDDATVRVISIYVNGYSKGISFFNQSNKTNHNDLYYFEDLKELDVSRLSVWVHELITGAAATQVKTALMREVYNTIVVGEEILP